MKKDDCIFCKLANGEIPTNALYEDDIVKVIFDASPAAKGHVLILPKEHFDDIYGMDDTPKQWLDTLIKKDYLIDLANKFENIKGDK